MMLFNLVDTYYVAKLGTFPLAAMGFTFPVILTVAHVSLGMGIGTSSVISRAIGEGDHHKVQQLTTHSLYLSVIIVCITIVIGLQTIEPLFTALGANAQTMPFIKDYMKIWYIGSLFLVVPMVGNHAIRASGDTFIPGMIMIFGSIINIILDPILIFGWFGVPALGIKGAAWATLIARALTMFLSLWVLIKHKHMIAFESPILSDIIASWKKILHIGLPSSGSMLLPTICLAILTRIVSTFGQSAVAGYGVAGKIEGFGLVIFIAVSTIFGPFVGQNWGAQKINRVRKALTKMVCFSIIWGTLQAIILFLFAHPISAIFNRDPDVLPFTLLYLKIIPISYGLLSILYLVSSTFNAIGRPLPGIFLMIVRLIILQIPLALLGKKWFGYPGFLIAQHISGIIVAFWSYIWIRKICKRKQHELETSARPY